MRASRELLDDHVANLRDLGGLPTCHGLALPRLCLLRSSAIAPLPDSSIDAVIALIGQGTYFDLRTDREVTRDGEAGRLAARGWNVVRLPICDLDPDSGQRPGLVEAPVMPVYLAAAVTIASRLDRGRPSIVSCSLGKDRTGIVIALLLGALGVPEHEIVADFLLSNECLARQRPLLPDRWRRPGAAVGQVRQEQCERALGLAQATESFRQLASMLAGFSGRTGFLEQG